jgi:NitT/TauT family transport system substrate-binding protein
MIAYLFDGRGPVLALAATLAWSPFCSGAQAQAPEKLSIVIFSAPSLGAFMPPVIKARKLDHANGLDIAFQERTPDAYTAQFNSGEFKVGGSASLLTIGLADNRGVKVKYLFNLFDFWGAVVTSRPEIKTLKDLEGKQLAAARATTNYVMFEFFAKKLGVDVSKIQVLNTATPGLVGYALANRADAVQIWEPAYTLLLAKKPDIRTLDSDIEKTWKAFAGGSRIPYLGVGAHADWASRIRRWWRSSMPPIRRRRTGSPRIRTRRRRWWPPAPMPRTSRRWPRSSAATNAWR